MQPVGLRSRGMWHASTRGVRLGRLRSRRHVPCERVWGAAQGLARSGGGMRGATPTVYSRGRDYSLCTLYLRPDLTVARTAPYATYARKVVAERESRDYSVPYCACEHHKIDDRALCAVLRSALCIL